MCFGSLCEVSPGSLLSAIQGASLCQRNPDPSRFYRRITSCHRNDLCSFLAQRRVPRGEHGRRPRPPTLGLRGSGCDTKRLTFSWPSTTVLPSMHASPQTCPSRGFLYTMQRRFTVLAACSGAKFELLWPLRRELHDLVLHAGRSHTRGGGRLNRAVNLPSQRLVQSGSGLDPQGGALSWGSTYRNFTNAPEAIAFPVDRPGSWP
jgi:hypothetical protein